MAALCERVLLWFLCKVKFFVIVNLKDGFDSEILWVFDKIMAFRLIKQGYGMLQVLKNRGLLINSDFFTVIQFQFRHF